VAWVGMQSFNHPAIAFAVAFSCHPSPKAEESASATAALPSPILSPTTPGKARRPSYEK
jgi:hypothetical protein